MSAPSPGSPATPSGTHFFLIAERGILECQAVLLVKTIRRLAGSYANSLITVISPRASRRPSRETMRELSRMDVECFNWNLNSPCPDYGPSFRVFAAARMERQSKASALVQLDSDALFLREPDFSLTDVHAAARPVDVKGMCTAGPEDPFDVYWRSLCESLAVDYNSMPWVTTTVDRKKVRASYNGGLFAVRPSAELLQQTEEFFLRMAAESRRPWANTGNSVKSASGFVSREGSEFWGSSQAAFAMALAFRKATVQILPETYNVPLHSFDELAPATTPPIHVHYHWLGAEQETGPNPMVDGRLLAPAEVSAYLRREFPLRIPKLTWFEKWMPRFLGARS